MSNLGLLASESRFLGRVLPFPYLFHSSRVLTLVVGVNGELNAVGTSSFSRLLTLHALDHSAGRSYLSLAR